MRIKGQLKCCILAVVLFISFFYFNGNFRIVEASKLRRASMVNDALIPHDVPRKHNSTVTPGNYETSEYLIGSVAAGIIFLESNGTLDPSTENWAPTEESNVISEIQTALSWWASQNPSASVNFKYDIHYRVPTSYEPISRWHYDEDLWISEAMRYLGYSSTYYFTQVRDYINALRATFDTNWAFAIFIVDSSNDGDGMFADVLFDWFAYSYLGGPFLVMTYDNNGWGISNMDRVTAHEVGHIFYATDEYDGETEYSGYLNVADVEGSGGIMDDEANWYLSSGTRGQVGWRDSDGDGIQDIVDTFPDTTLLAYSPNPTNNPDLTYTGMVTEVPYPNKNPKGNGKNVTINTIINVQYRVDSGAWLNASATDGLFDEAKEDLTFTTSSLSSGTHHIEVKGKNSVGNTETSFATDTITVDATPPTTSLSYSTPHYIKDTTMYISKSTTLTLNASDVVSGVAITYYRIDSGSWKTYAKAFNLSGISDGSHTLQYYSLDNAANQEPTQPFSVFIDNTGPTVSLTSPSSGSALNSSKVNLSWSSLDDSEVDHYEIRIDSGNYINKGLAANHTLLGVIEGSHTVYLKAFDKLGNQKETTLIFVVDITSPLISITSPQNGSEIRSSTVKVSWSGLDEVSGIDYYKVRLDGKFWIDLKTNTSYAFAQVGDGSHTIDVEAVDKAGNYWKARIHFIINTSLLGGPGWIDDAVVFGTASVVALIATGFFVMKRKKKQDSIRLESATSDLPSN